MTSYEESFLRSPLHRFLGLTFKSPEPGVAEWPTPVAEPNEAVVRVRACGLNHLGDRVLIDPAIDLGSGHVGALGETVQGGLCETLSLRIDELCQPAPAG